MQVTKPVSVIEGFLLGINVGSPDSKVYKLIKPHSEIMFGVSPYS